MERKWRSRTGARGPATQGSAATSASGRVRRASMSFPGAAGSRVDSRKVMIRSAGSASFTATSAEGKAAASITSAQRTSSDRSGASKPKRWRATRAMKPVQEGAVGSQKRWPERSASKWARSEAGWKALWW